MLPKYEARVDVPSSILATDPVRGTASAKWVVPSYEWSPLRRVLSLYVCVWAWTSILKISLVCVFGICKDYTLRLFMQSVLKECITIMMYGSIFFPYSNVSSHKTFTYIYIIYRYTFGKPLVGAKVEVTAKFKYYWEKTPQPNISLNGTVSKHFFVCKISHLWSLRSDFHPFFLHWHWHNNSPTLCFVLAFILTAGFQRRVSIYLQHQRSCRACE